MTGQSRTDVILKTLGMVNAALEDDRNALVATKAGEVNPSKAYIELVQDILKLNEPCQPQRDDHRHW
jgi:hypothetical protein